MKFSSLAAASILLLASPLLPAQQLKLEGLRNPVWTSSDNLRDPSILKVKDGYHIFYSRFLGTNSGSADNWSIATAFTRDFVHYENDRDISPKGFASPGDLITWHGKMILPYQSYPKHPSRLCYSTTEDFQTWSEPVFFLAEANQLAWNTYRRVIDPTFVVQGDTLHCFFVGSSDAVNADGKKMRCNLLGHAITKDPNLEKWEILTKNAPLIGTSKEAPDGVENIMILRTGDHWTMIYSEGLAAQHLAYATSKDLENWKLEGPLEVHRQSWMARKYGAPFVWQEDGRWMMILMGENAKGRTTFGLLTSPDGKKWTPLPE